jgi:hypothetical protein
MRWLEQVDPDVAKDLASLAGRFPLRPERLA